jgi:adenosine deaminase
VRVLLDSVRQWGVEAASRVLDLHEEVRWSRVVGFGLGGDEDSLPARAFAGVYRRVRRLSLAPLVHAGERGGPDSVAEALEHLRPVRIAHGIAAAADPALVRRLARSGVVLDVCPTSNRATGALGPGRRHPGLDLLRAGVRISLGTDDPGLFGTTLRGEYLALSRLGASARELRAVLSTGLSAALDLGHGR